MEYINVNSYHTLHNLIDDGLKVSVINGVKRISKKDIDNYMKSLTEVRVHEHTTQAR